MHRKKGQQQGPPKQQPSARGSRNAPAGQKQRFRKQQRSASRSPGAPAGQQQGFPKLQPSARGSRSAPAGQKQRFRKQQRSASRSPGAPAGQQQGFPKLQPSASRSPGAPAGQQQGFPKLQPSASRSQGAPAGQQQGFPKLQPSASRSPGAPAGQQQGFPKQQPAAGDSIRAELPQKTVFPFQKGKGIGASQSQSVSDVGQKPLESSSFTFPERIIAAKKSGTPIVVSANFFRLTVKNFDLMVYHYDVSIEPDKPKFLLRAVWNKFLSLKFPNRMAAFDGKKNAFSKGPLTKDNTCQATVTVLHPESGKEKEFTVTIKEVRQISFKCFQNYQEIIQKNMRLKLLPFDEITVLHIILKNWASDNFVSFNNYFFPQVTGIKDQILSERLIAKAGYYQSAFLGYTPYLNFGISHKVFYNNTSLLKIYQSFISYHSGALDVRAMNSFLKTVKVEYELPNDRESRRVFRVNELVKDARTQTFIKDGTRMSVAEYFEKEKKCPLRQPGLPLLWVGPSEKSIYLPMEFCSILPNQIYKREMEPQELREMIKGTASNTKVRAQKLYTLFGIANINSQPLMKEFELSVSNEMEKVPARILEPPQLKTSTPVKVLDDGTWKIKDFLEPVNLNKWCILITDRYTKKESVMLLQKMIQEKGKSFRMQIADPRRDPVSVDPSFSALKKAFSELKNMEIVFVIISEQKGLYSKVKMICETQEGVLTQCIKSRTISQDPFKLSTTVQNILLKVNAKLGGKNHCLNRSSVPQCLDGYVMVVGADVTHPSPGSNMPSVAAVAVSCDAAAFQYSITTRIQQKQEIIIDLQEIIEIHLKRFYQLRKKYPDKIIFFRDGVSEGELPQVFIRELKAVKKACDGFCQPLITFVVVQKRHHVRFFPTRQKDEQGKNFNVPVGTCVDTQIVHPQNCDFYLLSHASIQGTARPTRYRLLHDDNKLTDEEIERITFYLCHLYSRCNRSVSYPSPTYYAHLAAFRNRVYLNELDVHRSQNIADIQKQMPDNISKISPMFFV